MEFELIVHQNNTVNASIDRVLAIENNESKLHSLNLVENEEGKLYVEILLIYFICFRAMWFALF